MLSLRTALPLAVALLGMTPGSAWALTCECSDGAAVTSTLCESERAERCDSIEDCASLLPFSRTVNVWMRPASPSAELRAPRLSWCERASDPECSAADPKNERSSSIATTPVALASDIFSVPPQGGAVMRSTTMTKTVKSLVGDSPAKRLDRPPR